MTAEPPVQRCEFRNNRDAYRLAVMVLAVFALFLVVLGIAAFNARFYFMPLVGRKTAATIHSGKGMAFVVAVTQPRGAGKVAGSRPEHLFS